jgi:mono/diheme cytochrome c family protein
MHSPSTVRPGTTCLVGLLVLGFAIVFPVPSRSQDQANPKTEVKKVPVHQNTMVAGDWLYRSYCASCHGLAGKGNGPAAPALKVAPPDLTVLAKNNSGKFPDLKVMHILENGTDLAAHGSKEMPVWGPIFRSLGANPSLGHLRQVNLTDFLKSIQEK